MNSLTDKPIEIRGVQPCPKCGSENKNMERFVKTYTVKCSDCGWCGRTLFLQRAPRGQRQANEVFLHLMKTWNKDVANEKGEKRAKPIRRVEV